MKEKQGSSVSRRFQNRGTERVVVPFTEMRKSVEERKRSFMGGVAGGDEGL